MDLNASSIRNAVAALKEIDEQLAYLAVLTAVGSKPLSRWEKPLADEQNASLDELDLYSGAVPRTLLSGKVVIETVFSRSPSYVQMYRARFADAPIDKSPATQRCEGFLFGFPPCCVEAYIREPYQKNDLEPDQQKILFHWACKGCLITPLLLPEYQKIYQFVTALKPAGT